MRIAAIFLTGLLLAGCGAHRDETVLVTIDGKPLTAAMVKEMVLIQAKMAELSGRPIKKDEFVGWANKTAMELVVSMANAELLDCEVARIGLKPEREDFEGVLADFNRQCRRKAATAEELAAEFGDLKEGFLRQYERDVRLAAYGRHHWAVAIPDDMVSQYFLIMSNQVKKAEAINETAWKNARKAYDRLKSGEPWAKVAATCSEDKLMCPTNERFAQEWIPVGSDGMGIKELAAELPHLEKGDFSKPFESREGILIVRVREKKRGVYSLARMLFRQARNFSVPPDAATVRRVLSERMRSKRQGETLTRLQDAAKFTYPLGTNFTYRIWKEGDDDL